MAESVIVRNNRMGNYRPFLTIGLWHRCSTHLLESEDA